MDYKRFLEDNNMEHSVIIINKKFSPSKIRTVLKDRPELYHITLLKDNNEIIKKYDLLDFEDSLKGFDRKILYKKVMTEDCCLYAFKDLSLVSEQTENIVASMDHGKMLNPKSLGRKFAKAGVLVFESDLGLEPEAVYRAYEDCWEIEMVFNQFDNNLELDDIRVQEDFSVIGNEFINTIAVMVSRRILNLFANTGVLDSMTYGDAMEDLSEVWRKVNAPEKASTNDGYWTRGLKKDMELMERLNLSKPKPEPLPKKRERSKKVLQDEGLIP